MTLPIISKKVCCIRKKVGCEMSGGYYTSYIS